MGAGPAGLETARVAATAGRDVTVFDAGERVGGKVKDGSGDFGGIPGFVGAAEWLEGAVADLNVDVRRMPMHAIVRITAGSVVLAHYDSRRETVLDDVHAAVWVGPQVPNDPLARELEAAGADVAVTVIGDARSPRRIRIRNAIREGYDFARRLG